MSNKTNVGSVALAALLTTAGCAPVIQTIKPEHPNVSGTAIVYNSAHDSKEVQTTPQQFAEDEDLQQTLIDRMVATNDTYFKNNADDPNKARWEIQKGYIQEGTAPVLVEVTDDGTRFCFDGIGQVLQTAAGKPAIDSRIQNGHCDGSEYISNFSNGTTTFDYAQTRTLEGLEKVQGHIDTLKYRPLERREEK